MEKSISIGVIGAGECPDSIYILSRMVGFEIGKRGWTMVCGGLGGVMDGAARGCIEGGGVTVGILPGLEKHVANPFIKIPIATGLGEGRNLIIVRTSDILIAISGGYGTLSEIALALKMGKSVIDLETWKNIQWIHYVKDLDEAIRMVIKLLSPV